MKNLTIVASALFLVSCASKIIADGDQVFLSSEEHPKYEVTYMPDSEIIPSLFKVTPKQKAEMIMKEKCPNGYEITKKQRKQNVLAQIDSTVNYAVVSFHCK